VQRDAMQFDVVIVGAGPAGLAAAIHLKQQAAEPFSVCVIDKAPEPGAHTLSGAVMDPRALDELIPGWAESGAPHCTTVASEQLALLTQSHSFDIPRFLQPNCLNNRSMHLVRLGHLVQWLSAHAEALGVDVFYGFSAADVLIDEERVVGVVTGDQGLDGKGLPGPAYQPGVELRARYTLFAEGCRGHLGKQLEQRFSLRTRSDPQTHAIGLKELWRLETPAQSPGYVLHTLGWPLDRHTYGGGFVYQLDEHLLAVGIVIGLDYVNPYLSPYRELQRYKHHPIIRPLLESGKRLAYGARAIATGGLQSLPRTVFPGGVLIGDDAGYLNAARQKGIHAAMKSGMLAAEAASDALTAGRSHDRLTAYPELFRQSWLYEELYRTRNFKPLMKRGLWPGASLFGVDQLLLRGLAPWTLRNRQPDHASLLPAAKCEPINYPAPDNRVSFDLMTSVSLTNTHHAKEQPCHLRLKNPETALSVNLTRFDSPEQYYCPAGVYEIVHNQGKARLQINAQNCIHCKSCDIKDPSQNIDWLPPQGGDGPIYHGM